MSIFTYDQVCIPYALQTNFNQEAVYDDSDTNFTCMKFDITVQGIISPPYAKYLAPDVADNADPATVLQLMRSRLLTPRKTLSVTFGGKQLIPAYIAGNKGTVDAKNGPLPQFCNVTQLTNASFLLTFRIIAHYWETSVVGGVIKTATQQTGSDVLTNRWSESVSMDERMFSTRTRAGKFIIRSDNASGMIADEVRSQMAVVGVPKGFKRKSTEYTVDPSGLAIAYTIVDEEKYINPPAGVHVAKGTYTETTTKNGAVRMGEVHLTLEGAKDADQTKLVETAFLIAGARLRPNAILGVPGAAKAFAILDQAQYKIEMYDNVVEVVMRARLLPAGRFRLAGAAAMNFTASPTPAATQNPPEYTDRGTAQLLLHSAAYYDPSLSQTRIDKMLGQLAPGVEPGVAGKQGGG